MSRQEQIKIGITGSIGVGKTYVSDIFNRLGFPVFNADLQAKECMIQDQQLESDIKHAFGNKIYINGVLQKDKLADIVFNDIQSLNQLNTLVHPVVKKRFKNWCEKQTARIVFKEAAILFESGTNLELNKVICVSANKEVRIKRVISRENISREQIISRIDRQISQSKKEKLSDFLIINDGIELLLPQVIHIINQIS